MAHSGVFLKMPGFPAPGRGLVSMTSDTHFPFIVSKNGYWPGNAALPVLSAYLGHKDLSGTQGYLRLTADMYPDIIRTMELRFGDVVPGGETDEES